MTVDMVLVRSCECSSRHVCEGGGGAGGVMERPPALGFGWRGAGPRGRAGRWPGAEAGPAGVPLCVKPPRHTSSLPRRCLAPTAEQRPAWTGAGPALPCPARAASERPA